jgi:hypothetical protein
MAGARDMNTATIEVTVTTTDDREDMFAELFADGTQWGEVTLDPDTGEAGLTIFPSLNGVSYRFSVADVRRALDEAETRLQRLERRK